VKPLERLSNFLTKIPRPSKRVLLLILTVATITIIISTLLSMFLSNFDDLYVPSLGTIRVRYVEVYGGNLTFNNGNITLDWGTIYPGMSINRSFYVQSKSNIKTKLIIKYGNWTFLNSQNQPVTGNLSAYMNLTSPQNGTIMNPNEKIYVTLTLSASSSPNFVNELVTKDVQGFSFDIYIYPSEI